MTDTDGSAAGSYGEQEQNIAQGLVASSYDALLSMARARRRRSGMRHTLMTEDILHESFLKLSGRTVWQTPEHFLRTASLAMRQVIVDHARRRLSAKRGGGAAAVTFDEASTVLPEFNETPEQIVEIDELLKTLEQKNPRWLRILDARYFAGLTEKETAELLNLSERQIARDWKAARSWLAERVEV
ncbi:MAG: ECF-type sigma factor [Pseudomonadota bacterium]